MDPLTLNTASFLDALIYGVTINATSQTTTITIEVEKDFHSYVAKLIDVSRSAESLIDLVLTGVESVRVDDLPVRNESWKEDEKPHDYEIADLKVRKGPFTGRYRLKIGCQLGQKIVVTFARAEMRLSSRTPGTTHDYETVRT